MRYRLFQYTLPAPPELEDLNACLGAQRVAAVTHHLMKTAGGGLLVFVVETVGALPPRSPAPVQPKVDYRERLSAEEFAGLSQRRARPCRDETTQSPPPADIRPRAEKAGGGALVFGGGRRRVVSVECQRSAPA